MRRWGWIGPEFLRVANRMEQQERLKRTAQRKVEIRESYIRWADQALDRVRWRRDDLEEDWEAAKKEIEALKYQLQLVRGNAPDRLY